MTHDDDRAGRDSSAAPLRLVAQFPAPLKAAAVPPGAGAEASLLLDDQLCFALYAAQRAVTSSYRPLLDELGLTYPQYLVLLVLWERGEIPVKELATALRLDYGTVSPLLKRLEAAGLVRRERAAHDERSVLVACTGRGEELRERATCVPGALLAATGLEAPEVARLREELWRLAARAEAAAQR